MASFSYKGLKRDGAPVEGRISAADDAEAISQLRTQGILAYEVRSADGEGQRFDRRRARPKDRHRFIRQLATLLKAGSPLLATFDSLLEEEPCRELSEQMRLIRSDLRGGGRLSGALSRHMPVLPDYAPRLVELGEATGSLEAPGRPQLGALSRRQSLAASPLFVTCSCTQNSLTAMSTSCSLSSVVMTALAVRRGW